MRRALIPGLLGEGFTALHPHVRAVHGGQNASWSGRASVQRGSGVIAQIAATIARLPPTLNDVPVTVSIEAQDGRETWTRRFGNSAPMQSTLCSRDGWLIERMGPVALEFQVNVRDGGMSWYLRRICLLGVPLPRRLFQVQARANADRGYRFFVAVGLTGIGQVIQYEGVLDVPG